jgi:hypothetical protein
MKIERTSYPGWVGHPTYLVRTVENWWEIRQWMYKNKVEHFLLSSGSNGYTFQVRENKEWFMLKWD